MICQEPYKRPVEKKKKKTVQGQFSSVNSFFSSFTYTHLFAYLSENGEHSMISGRAMSRQLPYVYKSHP